MLSHDNMDKYHGMEKKFPLNVSVGIARVCFCVWYLSVLGTRRNLIFAVSTSVFI